MIYISIIACKNNNCVLHNCSVDACTSLIVKIITTFLLLTILSRCTEAWGRNVLEMLYVCIMIAYDRNK